ncbi:DNA ligase D, ligase domain [compost metagenome]
MYLNKAASIFQAIEAIAATASKNEKEALVKQAGSLPLFMRIVRAAYDPFVNYGLALAPMKRDGLAPGSNTLDEEQFWNILDKLATRELSGTAARDAVQNAVDLLDEPSSALFRRIIAKDLRAGFTDGTVNRVFPGTFQEFPYMRCSLQAKSNMVKPGWWDKGAISQEKADGMFANVNRAGDTVSIHSRQGSPFPAGCMPELEAAMVASLAAETQTHGELVVYEEMEDMGVQNWSLLPREKGNGVLNSLLSGGALEPGQHVAYMAWDQIPLSAVKPKGKYETGYKTRLIALLGQLKGAGSAGSAVLRVIPTKQVANQAEAFVHYRELLAKGKEGTVVKHPDAIWKDGTSKDQVKLKLEVDVELRITGFIPGTPGTKTEATFGSLMCSSECGALEVGVSGFTDALRQTIHNDRERFLQKVVTVRANSVMAPSGEQGIYSLFLPRLVEVREDKTVADDLQRIKDQFAAAIAA